MMLRPLVPIATFFLGACAFAQPVRLAVAPVVVTDKCKFAGPDLDRTVAIMQAAATDYLQKACDATYYSFAAPGKSQLTLEDLNVDFSKPKDRTSDKLQAFGKAVEASFALLVLVEWAEQKNPETSAVVSSPTTAKSTNRVRIRIWLQDVAENRLLQEGKQPVEGEAKGPFFGTVNPREMTGDPTSKGIMIELGYKKRAEWLGRALVDALKKSVKVQLGLKDP